MSGRLYSRHSSESLSKKFRSFFFFFFSIFFSANPALKSSDALFPYGGPSPRPHPDPTQHPETALKRTQNGAKRSQTDPKRTDTEPKWTEIKLSGVGRPGGLSGLGTGVVRETENLYSSPQNRHLSGKNWHLSQEPRKGGFSKGGFCRVQCHAQGNKKYPGALGPAVLLAPQRHSQERRAFLQKNPF